MATGPYPLPAPQPLEIHDAQAVEKWKRFKRAWVSYSLAIGLKTPNCPLTTVSVYLLPYID